MNTIVNQDLLQKVNSSEMAVLVVDRHMNIQLINDAFSQIWSDGAHQFNPGDPFRKLLDITRPDDTNSFDDSQWENYVATRIGEIQNGNIEPYELENDGGNSLLYSVSNLSDDRRMISYFKLNSEDLTENLRDDAATGLDEYRHRLNSAIEQLENHINACNQALGTAIVENPESDQSTAAPDTPGRLPALPRKPSASPIGTNLNDVASQHAIPDRTRRNGPGNMKSRGGEERRKHELGIEGRGQPVSLDNQERGSNTPKETLNMAVSALPHGLLIVENEIIQYHNPRLLEIFGLSQGTVLAGRSTSEALAISINNLQITDKEAALERALSSIKNRESYTIEHTTKDHKVLRIDGIALENGLYLYTYSDITDMRLQQKELEQAKSDLEAALVQNKHSKDRFRAFAEANSDWFWEMDSDLRFSYFSGTFEDVTGVNAGCLLGKTRQETGIPGAEPDVIEAHLADLDAHRPFRDFTHNRKKQDGSTAWSAISGMPVFGAGGEFEGYVGVGRDVTHQVERQRELEDAIQAVESAERAKSEFLANMSHEIRTPMNGVMGMAELLAGTELDAKQNMFTDVIVKSGASLLTIINDILDFSKLDAGQMELDTAPFNLAEAIEDVAALVTAKVAEKDLELIIRINPALPDTMVGDVGRLRQVMTNLLGNAVKFTEKGHVYVNIDGFYEGNGTAHLKFAVKDTGIGIPKEDRDEIFNKFNQVDASATRKHEGTGLGLSIASSLINLMGGVIQVESELGQGSVFSFEIELPAEHSRLQNTDVIPGDMQGARVLIIDDNGVNRSILMEQMSAWEFDSAASSSGREGLRMVESIISNGLPLDLIILDYQMPVMSGGQVLQHLRENPLTKDIPVLMLTSVDSSQSNKKLNQLGAEGNLTKPARSSILLETILQIIANKREQVSNPAPQTQPDNQSLTSQHTRDKTVQSVRAAPPLQPGQEPGLDILVAEDNEVNQIVFSQILEKTGLNFKIAENGRLAFATYKVLQPRLILMDVSMPEMNGKEATRAIRRS